MADLSKNSRNKARLLVHVVLLAGSFLFFCSILIAVVLKHNAANKDSGDKATASTSSYDQPSATTKSEQAVPIQMIEVLVPVKDIPQGEPLQVSFFAKVSRPIGGLPQNVVRNYDDVKGKYARTFMPALEPVVQNRITAQQPVNIVADNIPKGYRAVTINVNATSGVEGWATAGAHVDVHWVSDVVGEKRVVLLVQNVKVLSAERQGDPSVQPDPARPIPTTVTLLVTDRDAQKISLAASSGTIVLHLRGAEDVKGTGDVSSLSLKDVMQGRDPEAAKKKLQGTVKITNPDGSVEEIAVIDGKLMNKVE